jgi:hypothetical protein
MQVAIVDDMAVHRIDPLVISRGDEKKYGHG